VLSLPPWWSADCRNLVKSNDRLHSDRVVRTIEKNLQGLHHRCHSIDIVPGDRLGMLGIHPRRRLSSVRSRSIDPHHLPHLPCTNSLHLLPRTVLALAIRRACVSELYQRSIVVVALKDKGNLKGKSISYYWVCSNFKRTSPNQPQFQSQSGPSKKDAKVGRCGNWTHDHSHAQDAKRVLNWC
jgi:hypothetical protein